MGTTIYLTNNPRVFKAVLAESKYFTKTTFDPSHLLYFMANKTALFMCDISLPAFKVAHKFIPPSITPKAAAQYIGFMQQAITECFLVLNELNRQQKAFYAYQYMFKIAGQIIYRVVLGLDVQHFKTINTPAYEIIYLLKKYMKLIKRTSLQPWWYKYFSTGWGVYRRLLAV